MTWTSKKLRCLPLRITLLVEIMQLKAQNAWHSPDDSVSMSGTYFCRRAKDLVQSNIEILHKTANVLIEKEQIDGEEFQRIVAECQAEQYLKPDAEVDIPYREPQYA